MLFNSFAFLFAFLPIVLLLWWSPKATTWMRLAVLTLASYIFYGWWDYRFVGLLVFSSLVDYAVGHQIFAARSNRRKRAWLLVSLGTNLGLLAFFKYCGFFAESMNAISDWLRWGGSIPVPAIILPVGISFYTFQTLSYSIDIYNGIAKPAHSLLHFMAYVALFPQLIAGPIVRYGEIEDQLRHIQARIDWDQFALGIFFFVAGMCQKVLLADTIAAKVDPILTNYGDMQFFAAWFCMLGYTVQLYFDFAGYSNMAVGLGHMLGFRFPQNFDSPYKSASIAEFWRRWHMTLSFWLRDYLFIPLGGSRYGDWLTLRNLAIVMLLGGLWHGAGWTFVLWGMYHGLMLIVHAVNKRNEWLKLPQAASVAVTLLFVMFGWVLFRSADVAMCSEWFASLAGLRGVEGDFFAAVGGKAGIVVLLGLLSVCLFAPNLWQIRFRPNLATACGMSMAFALCILRFSQDSPFLYFQF